ncbi:MAG: V-type ATPase subunit [Candidatus Hydrogenedentes bacterium]|nr:V-type ATPase subunit [Candidatus Hydrogenedentota bacterium]
MIALTPFQSEWGFVCGRVSALEARLLSPEFFQTLVSHSRVEDMMRQLQESPLRESVVSGSDWQDWSGIIDGFFHTLVKSIRSDCPNPAVANIFILRDDYLNLKLAVTGQTDFPFAEAMLSREQLRDAASGDASVLPAPFRETAEEARAAIEEERGHTLVDVILDAAYLRHLLALGESVDAPLVRAYAADRVASRALVALWRRLKSGIPARTMQQYMLPMGSLTPLLAAVLSSAEPANWAEAIPGDLGQLLRQAFEEAAGEEAQRFDDLAANHLVTMARRGQGQVAGPERVLSFLRTVASETHNMKLIVCGRLSRIEGAALKQRMRVAHV